jgi:hypothetical protein
MNTFTIDGQTFPMKSSATFDKVGGKWRSGVPTAALRKSHGMQGPIDDAFMDAFLCVRPASVAAPSAVNDFALEQLDRFAREFPRWMRGDVRMKNDREVKPADVRDYNIVIFGTSSTNPMIQRALVATPIHWTSDAIVVGSRKYDAATHMLSMIYPNPANHLLYRKFSAELHEVRWA